MKRPDSNSVLDSGRNATKSNLEGNQNGAFEDQTTHLSDKEPIVPSSEPSASVQSDEADHIDNDELYDEAMKYGGFRRVLEFLQGLDPETEQKMIAYATSGKSAFPSIGKGSTPTEEMSVERLAWLYLGLAHLKYLVLDDMREASEAPPTRLSKVIFDEQLEVLLDDTKPQKSNDESEAQIPMRNRGLRRRIYEPLPQKDRVFSPEITEWLQHNTHPGPRPRPCLKPDCGYAEGRIWHDISERARRR